MANPASLCQLERSMANLYNEMKMTVLTLTDNNNYVSIYSRSGSRARYYDLNHLMSITELVFYIKG